MCWDKYEQTEPHNSRNALKDEISVQGQGIICITGFRGYYEVGNYMEIHINKDMMLVAFKPVKEHNGSVGKIRHMHDSIVFTPPSFVRSYGLKKGRYPARWDDKKKWIVVDLSECDQSNVR